MLIAVLLVALLGAIFYLIFNKKNHTPDGTHSSTTPASPAEILPKVEASHEEDDSMDPILENCDQHPDERAVAICSVCKTALCETCVRQDDNINFCGTHFRTYISNEWVELTSVTTTANEPEKGIHVYHFQEELWNKEKLPTFIVTHYKIDVTDDQIESHVKLMVRKDDEEELKAKFNNSVQ